MNENSEFEARELPPGVRYNEDAAYCAKILEGLEKKGGYCPCRIQKTPENLCMCKEFRDQIADPGFTGYCHCRLYYKEADKRS